MFHFNICCIKENLLILLKLLDIFDFIMMSIVFGPKWSYYSCIWILMLLGQVMYMLCIPGRAPRTKETLPDFREKCRVTRHSRVFPRVDG